MLKRAFDILCAAILLTLSLPLLAVAAFLIKLDSEGPVIFHQHRMGRRFMRFRLFKLRTMNLHGEGPAYTLGADPRITRVGRWLRRYKIDEVPQLWNVMRGDMSMVGPRPVIPELAFEFDWAYARLLAVRPGLTDPASLKYSNETEILAAVPDAYRHFKRVITPDKIRISLAYLQHAGVWTDFALVVKTALALVSPALRQRFGPAAARHDPALRISVAPQIVIRREAEPLRRRITTPVKCEVPVRVIQRSKPNRVASDRDSWTI